MAGTPPSTVHVGVDYLQVAQALAFLEPQPNAQARVEGDGWYVWGEKVGANGNDDCTFHVQIETSDPLRTLFSLLRAGIPLRELGPEGWASSAGVVAVITDAEDHDLDVVEITRADLAGGLSDILGRLASSPELNARPPYLPDLIRRGHGPHRSAVTCTA